MINSDTFSNRISIDCKEKYGLEKNKGYGTKQHLDGIKEHGITIWHRRSFGICKAFQSTFEKVEPNLQI